MTHSGPTAPMTNTPLDASSSAAKSLSGEEVLILDDDPAMRELLEELLPPHGIRARGLSPDDDGWMKALDRGGVGVVLTDLRMPRIDGMEVLRRVQASHPDVLVIVMTAFGSLDAAVAAMKAGAWDFIPKPIDTGNLVAVLRRALAHHALRGEVTRLRQLSADDDAGLGIVGADPTTRALRDAVRQVAPLDVTVLVTGESGTGKEVVARALHQASTRRGQPFVAVNCAALPEALLESQLFGHAKGAFTDARNDRAGLFAEARGGTILLDEFGELPLPLQPKLLRVLQERTFRPLGAHKDQGFEGRLVVATNRDLEQMVAGGRFREDLYYRVNVMQLELLPLRERKDDILPLAQHLLARAALRLVRPVAGITPECARVLLAHTWPGNVRELGNAIERAVALCRGSELRVEDLPERVRRGVSAPMRTIAAPAAGAAEAGVAGVGAAPAELATADAAPAEVAPAEVAPAEVAPAEVAPAEVAPAEVATAEVATAQHTSARTTATVAPPAPPTSGVELIALDELERRHVLGVLAAVNDNRARAAAILGIDPKTLYRKLRGWGQGG